MNFQGISVMKELIEHLHTKPQKNDDDSCLYWIQLGSFVFDITWFRDDHPGRSSIFKGATDSPSKGANLFFKSHSTDNAFRQLNRCLIGRLRNIEAPKSAFVSRFRKHCIFPL